METMDDVINQVHALEARVAELERYALRVAPLRLEDHSFTLTRGLADMRDVEAAEERAVLQRRDLVDLKRLIGRIGELAMAHGHAWADADAEEALTTLERLDAQLNALKRSLPMSSMTPLYYFGVGPTGIAGHYWHRSDGNRFIALRSAFPWRDIDQMFAPHTRAPHERKLYVGRVTLFKGWSVLAWWDTSGDNRPGSNSALVAEGRFSFDEMVAAGREQYPWVFDRIKPALLVEEE